MYDVMTLYICISNFTITVKLFSKWISLFGIVLDNWSCKRIKRFWWRASYCPFNSVNNSISSSPFCRGSTSMFYLEYITLIDFRTKLSAYTCINFEDSKRRFRFCNSVRFSLGIWELIRTETKRNFLLNFHLH